MAHKLHRRQRQALHAVWLYGMTSEQVRLVNALDCWFDEYSHGPTFDEMVEVSGLPFRTIWQHLPVLEEFGFVWINRDRKGRIVPRGIVLQVGFDWEKDV